MPKIVIVDTDFENNDFEVRMAKDAGVDIALFNEREPEAIIRNAADADGVVTSYGKFPPKVFEALPNLRVVSRTGIGYDDIDVPAATKNGTAVCVVPGYGTEVVSDHAITLALCVLRRLNETDADMRAGIWDYTRHRPYGQVFGRVFGVVGMQGCWPGLQGGVLFTLSYAGPPHARRLRHPGVRRATEVRRCGQLPYSSHSRHPSSA